MSPTDDVTLAAVAGLVLAVATAATAIAEVTMWPRRKWVLIPTLSALPIMSLGCASRDHTNHEAEVCAAKPVPGRVRDGDAYLDVTPMVPVYRTTLPVSVLDVPPRRMVSVVRDAYRLKPDRRFLHAVSEIHQFVTGEPAAPVTASFHGDHWAVVYRGEIVGKLPESPSYTHATALLSAWARCLAARRPLPLGPAGDVTEISRGLRAFYAPDAVAALAEAGTAWRAAPNAQLLALAAHGVVLLAVQSLDPFELADRLHARALALVTIAREVGSVDVRRDEALLAHFMGYTADAAALAATLPAGDGVRLYATNDTVALRTAAEAPSAEHLTRYLYLLRLSEGASLDRWVAWLRSHAPPSSLNLSTLNTAVRLNDFNLSDRLPPLLPYLTVAQLWHAARPPDLPDSVRARLREFEGRGDVFGQSQAVGALVGTDLAAVSRRFEGDLALLDAALPGPFLDAETYRAYLRGFFYANVWVQGLHLLDGLSSVEASSGFLDTFRGVPTPMGSEIDRWYGDLTRAKAGEDNLGELIQDLTALSWLGQPALERTYEAITDRLEEADTTHYRVAKLLAQRLDTRPHDTELFSQVAFRDLMDIPLALRHEEAVLRAAPDLNPELAAFHAGLARDTARLRQLTQDPRAAPEVRAEAIEVWTDRANPPPAAVEARWRAVIGAAPERWDLRRRYLEYLEPKRAYEEGLAQARDWVGRTPDQSGFDYIAARTAIARMLYRMGRYRDAWREVEYVAASGQSRAVGWSALIMARLGRVDEALGVALRLVGRYPDNSWVRAVLAEMLWRRGQYQEAAAVLRPPEAGHRVSGYAWRQEVAEAFVSVFGDRPLSEIPKVIATLRVARVPYADLSDIAFGTEDAGRPDLSFAIQTSVTPSGRNPNDFVLGYEYLRAWKGQDSALTWLRSRLTPGDWPAVTMEMYRKGEPQLLWDAIGEPSDDLYGGFIWLLRAVAVLERGAADDPHRAQVRTHFEGARGWRVSVWPLRRLFGAADPYAVMGRYLMDLEDEAAMLDLVNAPDRRCEVSYYLGVKALAQGRPEAASAWFRVTAETGQEREGEWTWAQDRLRRWARDGWGGAAEKKSR